MPILWRGSTTRPAVEPAACVRAGLDRPVTRRPDKRLRL